MFEKNFLMLLSYKEPIKSFLYDYNLGRVWDLLPAVFFNWQILIGGLLPCLLIMYFTQRFKARKLFTPGFVLDSIYPIFTLLITSTFNVAFVAYIYDFYKNNLTFMPTDILSEYSALTQFIVLFLVVDFVHYWTHRMKHAVSWFWPFHAIHHHQRDLNPMTTHRVHFCEIIILQVIIAIPMTILGGTMTPYIIYVIVNNFWGYFIHSDIRINCGILNKIVVTPEYHRIHHSIEKAHYNKNYGERLLIWDYMFNTYIPANGKTFPDTGVKGTDKRFLAQSLQFTEMVRAYFMQLYYPFYCIFRKIKRLIKSDFG